MGRVEKNPGFVRVLLGREFRTQYDIHGTIESRMVNRKSYIWRVPIMAVPVQVSAHPLTVEQGLIRPVPALVAAGNPAPFDFAQGRPCGREFCAFGPTASGCAGHTSEQADQNSQPADSHNRISVGHEIVQNEPNLQGVGNGSKCFSAKRLRSKRRRSQAARTKPIRGAAGTWRGRPALALRGHLTGAESSGNKAKMASPRNA
jgi:hypothetical protein